MRDELDKYFLNTVIKTAKPKVSFAWIDIVDEIISTYTIPFDGGESIEAHIYAFRSHGVDFRKQLDVLLSNGYLIPSDKEENKYLLTRKAIDAKKFDTVEDYELSINYKPSDTKIDYKKFDKTLIDFLKKRPQKFGDISHIANEFINGDLTNKAEVIRQLHYLRDRDFIKIKDLPDDPMQLQDDWWGTLQGHNPVAGYKVEDLKAQLSSEYEKQSWWDRNPSKTKWLDWVIPFLLGIGGTLLTQKILDSSSSQPSNPKETTKTESTVSLKNETKADGQTTNDDSSLHNKDTLKDTLTKTK